MKNSFWKDSRNTVMLATLDGAVVCAVPIDSSTLALLADFSDDFAKYMGVKSANYKRAQLRHESRCVNVIDGDLLNKYCQLEYDEKIKICAQAGFYAEEYVLEFDDLIEELNDRVG